MKVVLLDYNMSQEQDAILIKRADHENPKLNYFDKKSKDSPGEESMIESMFPLGSDLLGVKLTARAQIYVFVKEHGIIDGEEGNLETEEYYEATC